MIKLKFFERVDFQQLINWIETPEFLLQWGGPNFRFPLDAAQLESYLKGANEKNSKVLIYSVVEKETDNIIGHISLGKIDRTNESARVGKVLVGDKNVRGKGIGQQMMTEILKIAFDELGLHRVSLGVFDFNSSAIGCYVKAGFKKEGLLRDSRKIGNAYWSLWEMSVLDNEWEHMKKAK
ncbi:GNAT family N-acetyltransferase [Halobacillus sp. A5]|uniref:GNAT family N-acetyltransferase n=1 Tax=Halobacillus sp. A5 TaxID=2880263 RepID=UPI0020A697CE|nr:GNAT family protein [Halobacillus sp. A5]MCP3027056.1 GNAT family N-acetyltransferase [Halobacillus sp. A5]